MAEPSIHTPRAAGAEVQAAKAWHHRAVAADKHDVVGVLRSLLSQWEAGQPVGWDNATIPAYLEAMAAWLDSYQQAYVNTGRAVPGDGWTVFVAALQAAAFYE